MSRHFGASIKRKLVDIAHASGKEAQSVLSLFAQERMLYRISQSQSNEAFVLKGGLLLYGKYLFDCRPTVDIDLMLSNLAKDEEQVIRDIKTACEVTCDDGIFFTSSGMRVTRTNETTNRRLIRLKIPWNIVGLPVRGVVLIDIGLGDTVIEKPVSMKFPVLIEDLPSPDIYAYSIEAIIAEKFEAAMTLGSINSRLKDFFDIYVISSNEVIDGLKLRQQVKATMQARGTVILREPYIFSKDLPSNTGKSNEWDAF